MRSSAGIRTKPFACGLSSMLLASGSARTQHGPGRIGLIDDDGYVSIVDRKKDMVLRGGLNVYSREVEDVLLTHPAVSMAAVIGVPDAMRGQVVRAYIVARGGDQLFVADNAAIDEQQFVRGLRACGRVRARSVGGEGRFGWRVWFDGVVCADGAGVGTDRRGSPEFIGLLDIQSTGRRKHQFHVAAICGAVGFGCRIKADDQLIVRHDFSQCRLVADKRDRAGVQVRNKTFTA